MKCPNCGSEVSSQAVHCKCCGMILPGTAYTQTNARPNTSNGYGMNGMNTVYTGKYAVNSFTRIPYQGQQPYENPMPYDYTAPPPGYLNNGYGYPPEYYRRRQSPQAKNLFFIKILTTLLSLEVVLDLLLIIMLFLR